MVRLCSVILVACLSVFFVFNQEIVHAGGDSYLKNIKSFFIQKSLNSVESGLISRGKRIFIAGRRAVVNDDNFIKNKVDAVGRSNCSRMLNGFAPLGVDGFPVNLHHLHQENDGEIIEILDSEHRYYSRELHSYKNESEIDRSSFNSWKRVYWQNRGELLCK